MCGIWQQQKDMTNLGQKVPNESVEDALGDPFLVVLHKAK